MPDTAAPQRDELEACTDLALGWLRDPANQGKGPASGRYDAAAAKLADELLIEFPFTFPLGRVVMAVAQGLSEAQDAIDGQGGGRADPVTLLSIAFLAAGKLDDRERQEAGRG